MQVAVPYWYVYWLPNHPVAIHKCDLGLDHCCRRQHPARAAEIAAAIAAKEEPGSPVAVAAAAAAVQAQAQSQAQRAGNASAIQAAASMGHASALKPAPAAAPTAAGVASAGYTGDSASIALSAMPQPWPPCTTRTPAGVRKRPSPSLPP